MFVLPRPGAGRRRFKFGSDGFYWNAKDGETALSPDLESAGACHETDDRFPRTRARARRRRRGSDPALLDPASSGLVVGVSIRWGPGFHMGLVMPMLKVPLAGQEPTYDVKEFHLRNASLLPTPEPGPAADVVPAPTTLAPK